MIETRSQVDAHGRKRACVLFCLLEIVINTLEHIPSMPVLLLGRLLGGVSTSLLFSAFESWMVAEHRRRGFPEAWLSHTFGLAAAGNGFVAVFAGLLAQAAARGGQPNRCLREMRGADRRGGATTRRFRGRDRADEDPTIERES